MDERALADVALPIPLPRALSYLVPDKLAGKIAPGKRVVCTVGARRLVGVVIALRNGEPPPKAKSVLEVLEGVTIPDDLLGFLVKLSSYYLALIGEVIRLALPPVDREATLAVE